MVEYGVNTGLNQINDANGVAGVFMGLLGDTTTGQLDKISSQVTVAQNMIAGLQSDLDNFEGKVDADDNFLALQAAQENFYQDYKAVNAHIQALTNLMNLYGSSGKCGSGVRIL